MDTVIRKCVDLFKRIEKIRLEALQEGILPEMLTETHRLLDETFMIVKEPETINLKLTEPEKIREVLNTNSNDQKSVVLDIQSDECGFPVYYLGEMINQPHGFMAVMVKEHYVSPGYHSYPSFLVIDRGRFALRVAELVDMFENLSNLTQSQMPSYQRSELAIVAILPIWHPLNILHHECLTAFAMDQTLALKMTLSLLLCTDRNLKMNLNKHLDLLRRILPITGYAALVSCLEEILPFAFDARWDRMIERAMQMLPQFNQLIETELMNIQLRDKRFERLTLEQYLQGNEVRMSTALEELAKQPQVAAAVSQLEHASNELYAKLIKK